VQFCEARKIAVPATVRCVDNGSRHDMIQSGQAPRMGGNEDPAATHARGVNEKFILGRLGMTSDLLSLYLTQA